jgi:hypothetical protein
MAGSREPAVDDPSSGTAIRNGEGVEPPRATPPLLSVPGAQLPITVYLVQGPPE